MVLATVLINLLTCLALLLALQKRLGGLPLREWGLDALKLTLAAVAAGLAAWALRGRLSARQEDELRGLLESLKL